ncbi:PilZ domain-containing protein [Halobacteriovorax sp. JY17]|uniref:PilZ domain-containing protein n=1 Tax=Halobacteriovorax sp. JY17 TaxID=2014617 RepID=UPI000C4F7C63|nr:PilZ domain-containing protein [Halobacteriovorax sp. JY17]PIK16174.1 MAG: hypothetical protein CES88_05420 [Halobacteriovorax sp. JY17]
MEVQITKYYLIQSSGKVLKYCDIFEIVSLLESEELEGQSYVFDLRLREWLTVDNLAVLRDTNYQFKESAKRDRPSFNPPHKLPVGEFQSQKDSDYEYLLRYTRKLSKINEVKELSMSDKTETYLEAQLEKVTCDLNEKNTELLNIKSISLDFEEVICRLKSENSNLSLEIAKLEDENISLIEEREDLKKSSEKDIEILKAEYEKEITLCDDIQKINFKLSERNKTLAYALKLERSQRAELKSLMEKRDESSLKSSYSEELLSKAMDYFLHGPIGGDKEILEKKIALLNKELKELDEFYNIKIQKLKREFREESQTQAKHSSEEQESINILQKERDSLEFKYNNLLDLNEVLNEKMAKLEESAKFNALNSDTQEDFKEKYINLASKFKKLEKSYKELEEQSKTKKAPDSATKYLKEELIKAREQVTSFETRLKELSLENDSLKDQKSGVLKSDKKLNHLITNLRSDNKTLIEKYHVLKERTAKYKVAYNDLSEGHKKLKLELKETRLKFSEMTSKTSAIIDSLKSKVEGAKNNYSEKIKELEEVKDREKTLMFKIEEFKKEEVEAKEAQVSLEVEADSTSKADEELKRLIGDSFEVPNSKVWMIQNEEKAVSGPFEFSEVYHMKINGELDGNIKIKKGVDPYRVKADIFELSVPVITHGEGDSIRYFINRTSMRVPFYELITFEINGVEHRGYCTSLSLGGIFLELNELSDDFVIDKTGRVLFSAGAVDSPFQCVAQVKNISKSRPKGLGLMFVDLPDQARVDISFYINNYLNKTKQAA